MEINGMECCRRNCPQVKSYDSISLLSRFYEIQ
jgi:hypothetical protein